MTNEEAREQIENLRAHCSDMARSTFTGGEVLWAKDVEALDLAIKALAQEPCEDAISRDELLKAIDTWDKYSEHAAYYFRCSECGKDIIGEHNYCANCGCRMAESEE